MAGSALARLKKGANFTPTKRTVKLVDGSVFEFYAAPLNMAEREAAQSMPGGDDVNGFGLNLLVNKAMDENGQRLFAAGEIAELKNEVLDSDLQAMMLAVIQNPEEKQTDMKSTEKELSKDNLLLLQLGVAKQLGYSLAKLNQEITLEELMIWSAYFELCNEDQERRMKQRHR